MAQYSKINVIYRLQRWFDSVPGQTFLNYAYSWGAAIVILGTLFKLTHLPGANLMLYIGMGTEVVVFFISAFDRPFDKTSIGIDLPTHVADSNATVPVQAADNDTTPDQQRHYQEPAVPLSPGVSATNASQQCHYHEPIVAVSQGGTQPAVVQVVSGGATATRQQPTEVAEATEQYVNQLKQLTETLARVSEQSARLTTDSEEMASLNRTLTSISRVYEMQLKSASSQISTIDQINEQSRRMASLIEQLNQIYARMIDAMTVSMHSAAPLNSSRQA